MDNKNTGRWERTASAEDIGTRLDKFWARELADSGVSRGKVKSWIESGLAMVNGEVVDKGKYKLTGFDKLEIGELESSATDTAEAVPGDLKVIHEDDHVLVVDKAAGVTTHPAPGEPDATLVNHLLHQYPDMASPESGLDGQRPGIVHRLDKDTSGLIVVARTEADRLQLGADFAERRVDKVYLAVVHGRPTKSEGTIDAPIGRHPTRKTRMAVVDKGGREARSDYRVLWTGPRGLASLVAVRIHTGRTHQIRVHMAHIGHPLVGDATYGPQEDALWKRRDDRLATLGPRQMLHAFHLSFIHPHTKERLTFWQKPPKDILSLIQGLHRECLRVGIVGMPGCGKSTVVGFLREHAHPTFSADESVAELYKAGGDGAEMIAQRFGNLFSNEDGSVDKGKLFAAMCDSDELRREVMDMVHPMVRHECELFFRAWRDTPVAYAEVPLLLEGGWHKTGQVDVVGGVRCPEEMRTGPLRRQRGLSPEMLAVFDSWQWSEQDKLGACDMVIENAGSLDDLEQETLRLHDWATARFTERNAGFAQWLDALWPRLAAEFAEEGDKA